MFTALSKGPSAFQLKFKDRIFAANILAATIQDKIGKDLKKDNIDNVVALGIPMGGIIVADIVADKIKTKYFDAVIPRKLTDIDNKEQAIGSIMEDGTVYLDENLISDLQIESQYIEQEKQKQIQEIERRKSLYRKENLDYNILNDKIVILIDDGAATGATIIVAARWIKKNYNPKKLIIALPVASKDTIELLKKECDEVIIVSSPKKYFYSVG